MLRPNLNTLTVALAPFLLVACLSTPTIAPARYYTLTPNTDVDPGTPAGKSLGIRPLVGAKPYRAEVAYTAEPNRLSYFQRAEWAELAPTVVNRALRDGIAGLGRFTDVGDAADMARPDYVLTGELRRFEADYTAESPRAVVEVSINIRETAGSGTLWEGLVSADAPLFEAQPGVKEPHSDAMLVDVAKAMSAAITDLVQQVCAALRTAEPAHSPSP